MKTYKKIQQKLFPHLKLHAPVVFACLFGFVMLGIGLPQIFAQSAVAFIFVPTSQSANAGEYKSVSVTLYNNGQNVDGGSVAITFDPSLLDFISFSDSTNPNVSISNKNVSSGRYSYDFAIANMPQNNPDLGALVLRARSLSSSQSAYLRFEGINTKAHNGATYYQVVYGQAIISINAAQPSAPTPNPTPTPTPTPNPVPRPAPSPTPVSTNTNPSQNSTNSSNQPTAPPITSTANPADPSQGTQPVLVDPSTMATVNKVAGSTKTKHKNPLMPVLFIGGGILLIGAAAILSLKLRQRLKHQKHHVLKVSHPNPKNEVPADGVEENIVVKPDAKPAVSVQSPQPTAAEHVYPPLISTTHSAHHKMHKAPVPESAKPSTAEAIPAQPSKPEETPKTIEALPTVTKVKESTDQAHHKEVEVDIVRLKPDEVAAQLTPEDVKQPAPEVVPEPEKRPVESHPKPQATVTPPAPTKLLEHAHVQSPPHPKHLAPIHKPNPPVVNRSVPDWQAHLVNGAPKAPVDDPPDMFELAKEHPETFGSYHVLEAEDSQDPPPKKDTK